MNQMFDIREFLSACHRIVHFRARQVNRDNSPDNLPDLVAFLPVEVPDELLEAALALSDEEADPDPAMTLGLLAEIYKTSVI